MESRPAGGGGGGRRVVWLKRSVISGLEVSGPFQLIWKEGGGGQGVIGNADYRRYPLPPPPPPTTKTVEVQGGWGTESTARITFFCSLASLA